MGKATTKASVSKSEKKTTEHHEDAEMKDAQKKGKKIGGGSKKGGETYSVYIYRVLKQVHPETGISKRSMSIMNSFIHDIFEKIAGEAGKLVRYNKK